MKHLKKQTKKNRKELLKNSKNLHKINRETVHIRISKQFYEQIKIFKEENGKTASYWIDNAWKWYEKQNNFDKKL